MVASSHAHSPAGLAAITWGEAARDALAATALLTALALPWTFTDTAADQPWVIVATLLSVCSLSIGYLRAAGVLPESVRHRVTALRASVNLPFLLVFLQVLAWDILATFGAVGFGRGGIGGGPVLGLFGAVLAMLPRRSDAVAGGPREEALHHQIDRATTGALVALIAWSALTAIVGVIQIGRGAAYMFATAGGPWVAALTLLGAGILIALAAALLVLRSRRPEAALPLAVVAAGAVGTALVVNLALAPGAQYISALVPSSGSGFLLTIAALIVAGRDTPRHPDPAGATATRTLLNVGIISAALVILLAVTVIVTSSSLVGAGIVSFLAAGAGIVAMVALRGALLRAPGGGPQLDAATRAGAITLGVVGLVLLITAVISQQPMTDAQAFIGAALPGALLGLVLRDRLAGIAARPVVPVGPARPAGTAAPPTAAPTPPPPAPPLAGPALAPPPPPPVAPTAAEVLDPGLETASMQRITVEHPQLRVLLAANPSTYPALLDWLETQGDPAVAQVVRARRS